MFASTSAQTLKLDTKSDNHDLITKILHIHRLLKKIAKHESLKPSNYIIKQKSELLQNIFSNLSKYLDLCESSNSKSDDFNKLFE